MCLTIGIVNAQKNFYVGLTFFSVFAELALFMALHTMRFKNPTLPLKDLFVASSCFFTAIICIIISAFVRSQDRSSSTWILWFIPMLILVVLGVYLFVRIYRRIANN